MLQQDSSSDNLLSLWVGGWNVALSLWPPTVTSSAYVCEFCSHCRSSSIALLYNRQLLALLQAAVAAAEAQKLQPCIFVLDLLLPELQKMGKHLVPPTTTMTLGLPTEPQGMGSATGNSAEPPKQHIFHESMEARLCLVAALAWRGSGEGGVKEACAEQQQQQGGVSSGDPGQQETQTAAAATPGGDGRTSEAGGSEAAGKVAGVGLLEHPVALELLQWCWDMVFLQQGGYPVSLGANDAAMQTPCSVNSFKGPLPALCTSGN